MQKSLNGALTTARAWATGRCSRPTAALIAFCVFVGFGVALDILRGREVDATKNVVGAVLIAAMAARTTRGRDD